MATTALALRRDPLDVLASVAREPGAMLLEVPDSERPVTLVGCHPVAELRIGSDRRAWRSDGSPAAPDPLDAIADFVRETRAPLPFPLGGGAVGYLAYELGYQTVPSRPHLAPPADARSPLAVLRRYDPLLVHDRTRGQWTLVSSEPSRHHAPWLARLAPPPVVAPARLAREPLRALVPRARYVAAVLRILDYLHAGDAYQVNLTQPFLTRLAVPAATLFRALARHHPVPYAAYLDLGDLQLVGNSPELFLRRRGRRIETRPIKGTRPRGDTPAADAALAVELLRDEKERAEHVMIVDLERNDLGRVSVAGSVHVESLARVESHATVHHLVSTISGELRGDVGLAELLRATFPGGSITGAPKIRAMEIIAELETGARGPYTGAVGCLHPGGDLELGLAIRTAVVTDDVVRYHAGGGIVVDSDPERELAEAWLKTAALRLALGEPLRPELEQCSSG